MSGDDPKARTLPRDAVDLFSTGHLFSVFRRRLRLFAAVVLIILLGALVVTVGTTPRYTADAHVMLDTRQEHVVDSAAVLPALAAGSAVIDTEVEVIKARDLARQVAEKLRLENDPEFNWALRPPAGASLAARIRGQRPPDLKRPETPEEVRLGRERATSVLPGGLDVRRAGLTYIITISYTARDPEKAALIANAYAEQYVLNQISAKYDATRQANGFLDTRLSDLRLQVQAAEAAVERYRVANNLLSSSGATLTEQEISAFNQQLGTTRAEQAVEEARLRTARNQLAQGSTGDDVGEALQSTVIQQLRSQRATAGMKVADMEARYGPRHPELRQAQQEVAAVDEQIQAEIGRVISNLEARAQVARDRTASVERSLRRARGALAGNNAASVQLNELERTAEALRTIYEGLLDRYQETNSQTGIETADSRVISAARAPAAPSSPNIPVNLALGLAIALTAGMAAVIVSEWLDDGVMTARDVEHRFGLPTLGSVPLLVSIADRADRRLTPAAYLVTRPLSGFAEAFRSLRTSILYARVGKPVKVVAVTSALPGEGKTTTAICLAISAAQAGAKVVIVDCDVRRHSVRRVLGGQSDQGLLDVLEGAAPLKDVLFRDEATKLWVLPASDRPSKPQEVFNTAAMGKLLDDLRGQFELVILDTAPVLALAETRVLASRSDAVMFLTRWRKTPAKAAEAALRMLEQSEALIAGVILAQVDVHQQGLYGYGDPGHYYAQCKKYYLTPAGG